MSNNPRISNRQAHDYISKYLEFRGSNFTGVAYPNGSGPISRERGTFAPPLGCTYVVFSYATPIAWLTGDGHWFRSPQSFSPSTSQHQGQLPRTGTNNATGADPQKMAAAQAEYELLVIAHNEEIAEAKRQRARDRRAEAKERKLRAVQEQAEREARQLQQVQEIQNLTTEAQQIIIATIGSAA